MKSFAVSVLLLVGALLLGYCSGAINGTDTTPATPMTTGIVLTTVMNNTGSHNDTKPTANGTTTETPTDHPNITEKAVTTTEGSNTTTMSSGNATTNMSSMPTQPTTPRPQTTPAAQTTPTVPTTPKPEMSWKVMNGNETCQLMRFALTIKYYNTKGMLTDVNVSVPFEEPLSNVTGDCSSQEKRTFAINFYPDSNRSCDPWAMRFVFKTVNSNAFHLTSLSFELKYDDRFDTIEEGQFVYSYSSTEGPLGGVGAPIPKSFSCPRQPISSADEKDGLSIVFEDVELQPFAEKAQEQFGESVSCPYKPEIPNTMPEQSNSWMVATIIVSIIFSVFFLGTVGFCYYVKKHKAKPSDTYDLVETY